jgi:hypothetical protein
LRRKIFCSGVTMGTTREVMVYTRLMTDKINAPDFAACERNGVDQGMHNVFIHHGDIPTMRVENQTAGYVANMQSMVGRVTESMTVVNERDEPYAVVHQYDRLSELTVHLFKKYVYWDRSEGGTVCKDYTITKGQDLLRGMCDLRPAGGLDADMCCKVCDRDKNCQGFAHVRTVCFLKSCTGPLQEGEWDDGVTMGIRGRAGEAQPGAEPMSPAVPV